MRMLHLVSLVLFAGSAGAKCPPHIEADFRAALAARDEVRIYAATAAARACLGDPKPERTEQYEKPTFAAPEPEEFISLIWAYWDRAKPLMWWVEQPPSPSRVPAPLRQPAAVVRGAVLAAQIDRERAQDYLAHYAAPAAQYLLNAQAEGGADVFPVAAKEGPSNDGVFQLTDRFVKAARARGDLARVVRNGWIIDDLGGGDLQFDNGLAGEAILVLHTAQPNPKLLDAAARAGRWAMRQPLSTNFNYNGFSAALLARLYAATGDKSFRDEAIARVRLGVLPGMISDGHFAGHWIDQHNERLVYRMIMVRQMFVVAGALSKDDPDRTFISQRAAIAKRAIEAQLTLGGGIAHPGTLMTMYCDDPGVAMPTYTNLLFATQGHIAVSLMAGEIFYDPHAAMCALEEYSIEIQFQEGKARP